MKHETSLTSVHDAMIRAQDESRDNKALVPATTKVHPDVKSLCEEICERHGVTLSSFLRQCMHGLAADYNAIDEANL